MSRQYARTAARAVLATVLALVALLPSWALVAHAAPAAASGPITSNPYGADAPDCTWYAWQRLHDAEGIDMQFTGVPAAWPALAAQPHAFWSEQAGAYVQATIEPALTTLPAAGDLVVFPDPVAHWAFPSHVVFIETVASQAATFAISEQSVATYTPGPDTLPYPYVNHRTIDLAALRQAEPRASFIHFGALPPPPPVDGATLALASLYPAAPVGQPLTFALAATNTGNTTWSDAGDYRLVCVEDCADAVPAGLGGLRIPPGAQAQFTASLTAPALPDAFTTTWTLLHGAVAIGAPLTVTFLAYQPTSGDDARLVAESSVPAALTPGAPFPMALTFVNTGTTSWTDATGYRLDCDAPIRSAPGCLDGASVSLEGQSVAPGEAYTFIVQVSAPALPGTYHAIWDLHHNLVAFGDRTGAIAITLAPPSAAGAQRLCRGDNPAGPVNPTCAG